MKSDIKSSSHLFGEQKERAKVLCNANADFFKIDFSLYEDAVLCKTYRSHAFCCLLYERNLKSSSPSSDVFRITLLITVNPLFLE